MVDSEEPEAASRREASEELGINLRTLEHVGGAWTTPGISTEFMDLNLAPYSPADRMGRAAGSPGNRSRFRLLKCRLPICGALRARHPHLFSADAC
jgi:8-oxo-dGTP pyrophosphatase MutT (NUDIX family)